MTAVMAAVAVLALAAGARAQEEEDELRFAVMRDTTVFEEGVAAVVEHSCAITDAYEAVDDPSQACHAEALRMCLQMGDECGGYVIEPLAAELEPEARVSINFNNPFQRDPVRVVRADVQYSNSRGIVVKIIKAGAADAVENLVTVAGATLYEKRIIRSDPELLAQLYEQKLAERVEAAILEHAEIQAVQAEIDRRVQSGTPARPPARRRPRARRATDPARPRSQLREVGPRRVLVDLRRARRQGPLGDARGAQVEPHRGDVRDRAQPERQERLQPAEAHRAVHAGVLLGRHVRPGAPRPRPPRAPGTSG